MDKAPMQSKKFWVVLLALTGLLGIVLTDDVATVRMTALSVYGFLAAGYLGGQVWLDRYVQLGKSISTPLQRQTESAQEDIQAEQTEAEAKGPIDLNEQVNADKTIDG